MSDTSLADAVVLVTGAGGFLGSHLCERLLDAGAFVHATSRRARTSDHSRLRWWQEDLSNGDAAQRLLRETRPDVVYHLAGQVSAAPDLELVLPAFHSLLASTVHLLEAVTERGCRRFIAVGSLTEPLAPERGEPVPTSPYAAAKWASSGYARMFHRLYGTPSVVLRPFMTYGPRQDPAKLVPHVIRSLLAGSSPDLASGRWRADWIYVDDVIEGFLLAAKRPDIEGESFDLGTGALVPVRDVVTAIARGIGPSVELRFGTLPDRPEEQVRSADLGPARERLGFEAKTPLERGIDQTIVWYRSRLSSGAATD